MAVEVSTTTSAWIDSSGIWLFCIEKNIFSVAMRDCPSIKVNVRVGHVAPSDKTQVRRCILFADDGLLESTLSNKTSPALLVVKNSCDFKENKTPMDVIEASNLNSTARQNTKRAIQELMKVHLTYKYYI
ncbi:Hypothetical predicted protein [Mytilus galloprovincialis]|uniref:Uncharacterized protein n=1 Tax=Mytilus galloprovincialis TaxID=29158 RepID=A0A8B6D2L6_MYTGA|nr:Hypothetical predicted protein [Mytilus galloprovincialis]